MRTLDKSRPYSQVFGLGVDDGTVFIQDGVHFLGNGEEIVPEDAKPKIGRPAKKTATDEDIL